MFTDLQSGMGIRNRWWIHDCEGLMISLFQCCPSLTSSQLSERERQTMAESWVFVTSAKNQQIYTLNHIETWCPTLFFSTPSSNPAQIQLSPFPPATPACQLWWFSWATWTPFFYPELPSKFGVARCYHISGQTSSFPLIRKPIHFSKAKQKWER